MTRERTKEEQERISEGVHTPNQSSRCSGLLPIHFKDPNTQTVEVGGIIDAVVMCGNRSYWNNMTDKSGNLQISPVAILAGIGSLDRRSLCTTIATLETASVIAVAAESVRGPAKKFGAEIKEMADAANEAAEALYGSDQKDHALRHRLWRRMNDALNIRDGPPLSSRTARENSAALALRTSERLSPALRERHRRKSQSVRSGASLDNGRILVANNGGFTCLTYDPAPYRNRPPLLSFVGKNLDKVETECRAVSSDRLASIWRK